MKCDTWVNRPENAYHESDSFRVIGVTSATLGCEAPMDEPVDEYVGRHRLKEEADETSHSEDQVRPAVSGRDRTDTGQMEVSGTARRGVGQE
jgi:hypothetical protein